MTAPVDEVARAIAVPFGAAPRFCEKAAQAALRAVLARMRAHAAAEQSANGDFIVKWIAAYEKACASPPTQAQQMESGLRQGRGEEK